MADEIQPGESKQQYPELVFSGVQPSGAQVHIGNYLGAMRRFVTLSKQYQTFVCIVDLHALTSVTSRADLQMYSCSLAAAYLAIGLEPKMTIIFRQSDVPEVCQLTWYLACLFPLGLLERAHSVKDARAHGLSVNSGIMLYPILMAADIMLYKGTLVPVGADQKQHLEMTREIAVKFNAHFGEIFPVPEPLIAEDAGVVPGLDGRKMSKSYDNYIGLFESSKELKKKVMRIVTDSKSVDEKKDPEVCNIFRLYKLFATNEASLDLAERYKRGGMGYGSAKEELYKIMDKELAPLRDSYNYWIQRPKDLNDILSESASRARCIAMQTIDQVRDAVGVGKQL